MWFGLVSALRAQTVISEGFQTTTVSGWNFSRSSTATSPFSPLSGQQIGATGTYGLELSNNTGYTATAAQYTGTFSSVGASVYVQFDYQMYGGTAGTTAGHGGDGITFFLYDGAYASSFSPGAFGGSMGYAQRTDTVTNGLTGGYLGVGLDAYGNFSSASEGRVGGYNNTTGTVTESIGVRGPGSGTSGYAYLGGTSAHLGTGNANVNIDSGSNPTVTNNTVQILLTATNQLTVTLAQGGSVPQTVLQMDLSGYARPDLLSFGFTAGSGGATDFMYVSNLTVTTLTASKWTNASGNGNWGLNTNWNPSVVPTSGSDILFDNTTVSTAQSITLGADRTVRSLSFDAPFDYTISGNNITFNKGGVAGFSGIAVTQTHGSGNNTINSNLILANGINVRNNANGSLTLGGTITNGGNTVIFDGTGATTASGVISGSGGIIKNDTGSLTLSAANTYSGGTTVNSGTVNANNNAALGTGTVTLAGGTIASGTGATISNAISLTGDAGLSGITHTGSLTQTNANRVLTLSNVTQSGAVNLSNDNTTRNLTVQVDSGTSTISGVIANGGTAASGLTKTGSGTLVVSGVNTYTGGTTISNGTLQLGGNDRLAAAGNLAIDSSGTFNLNGYSQKVGNLTALGGGATIDFGTTGTANNLVFGTYTAPSSGVLVINNFENGTDKLGTTVGGQTVGSIYFSGLGVATLATSTTAVGSYGNVYLLNPTTASTATWRGTSSNTWGTGGNWLGGTAPTSSQVALFDGSATRTTATVSANTTVAGIQFATNALAYTIGGTSTLTLNGAVPYIQQKGTNNQTMSVPLSLGAATVVDITGSGNLTLSGTISGSANLVKDGTGSGMLILSGNNSTTYTGDIYINNGIVRAAATGALGSAAATAINVAQGATLELAGSGTSANAITVSGDGSGGIGAIHNVSGTNTLSGAITQNGATTYAADTGSTLTMSGTVTGTNVATTFSGAGSITAARLNTGTGNVTVNSTGTVTFNGGNANGYTGSTIVNSGTLALAKTAGVTSIAGNLVINGGAVQLNASDQIADTSTLSLTGSGTFNVNGQSETIAQLTSTSSTATVAMGAGALTLNAVNNLNSTYAGSFTGTSASSLNISGTGKVYLSGSSGSFAGAINVNGGSLNASGSNTVLGTGTVNVASGANVQLQGGISLANAFTINGTGTTTNGVIQNFGGSNAITGTITLTGASTIMTDTGSLALGAVTLGANTLTVGGANDTSIGGIVSGTGGLVKNDAGKLTLSGVNTYTGSVTINSGTVEIAAESGLGSTTATKTITLGDATLHVTGGFTANAAKTWTVAANATATMDIDASQTLVIGNTGDLTSSATSQLVKTGAGTLRLGANNTGFTGGAIVNAGTLELNTANALGTNRPLTLAGGTLALKSTSNTATSFASNVTVTADSTISTDRLSGTNTNFTYTLTSLSVGSNTLTTTGANGYDLQATTASLTGSAVLNVATAGSDLTLGTTSGSGSLTKDGAGTLILNGASANTFSGGITVKDGTLTLAKSANVDATGSGAMVIGDGTGAAGSAIVQLNAAGQINDATTVTINSDGRLNLNNNTERIASLSSSSSTASVTLGSGTLQTGSNNASTTFSGVISGTGGVTKQGTGTLTLNGANTFTGTLTASAGTVTLATSGTLANGASVSISNGATVTLGTGLSQTVAGLTTSASSVLDLGAGSTFTVTSSGASSLQGSVTGSGTLAYTGGGTLTLGNNLSLAGSLTFGGGTIVVGGNVSLGQLEITGNTILDFGNSTATTLNLNNLKITSGTVTIINWVNMTDYFITQNFTGATFDVRGSAPMNQITFTGFSNNQTAWLSYDHEITPAPEPSTYGALFVGAALGFVGYRRWRKNKKA